MTNIFEARFSNVEAIEDRIVSQRGEVFGLSRFKGRSVKIVVLEEPSSCATITYGAGIDGGVPVPSMPTNHGAFVDLTDIDACIENMPGESTPC